MKIMDKKLEEFKQKLPEGVFDKLVKNIKMHKKHKSVKETYQWMIDESKNGFSIVLVKGFVWSSSQEKHEFWSDIYDFLCGEENKENIYK